jgi:transposase
MQFFVGIDVSLETSSICVVDESGVVIKEGKALSDPQSIARCIRQQGRKIKHVGLEAGQLSQRLYAGLTDEGFSVCVMEARHVRLHLRRSTSKRTATTLVGFRNSSGSDGSSAFT